MSRITQKGATGPLAIQSSGTFQSSTDASLATLVGSRWDLSDGREVILASASSATTVAAGKAYQDAAILSNHQNCAVTAIQTYSNNGNTPYKLTITLGNTAATANQYAGGFAIVNAGTGLGQTLRIASHPAANASASLTLTLEDGPNTALSTSDSKVSLQVAHGNGIIITPGSGTGSTAPVVGVALYTFAASAYGFLVSKGVTAALSDTTAPANGTPISASAATAGAVGQTGYATNVVSNAIIGYSVAVGTSTEYRQVFVNL